MTFDPKRYKIIHLKLVIMREILSSQTYNKKQHPISYQRNKHNNNLNENYNNDRVRKKIHSFVVDMSDISGGRWLSSSGSSLNRLVIRLFCPWINMFMGWWLLLYRTLKRHRFTTDIIVGWRSRRTRLPHIREGRRSRHVDCDSKWLGSLGTGKTYEEYT